MTSLGVALVVPQRVISDIAELQFIHHGLKKVSLPRMPFFFDSVVMKRHSISPLGTSVFTGVPRKAFRRSGFNATKSVFN